MKVAFLVSCLSALASSMFIKMPDAYCPMLPPGSGPVVFPDTPEAFRNSTLFSHTAIATTVPANYTAVFINSQAAVQGSPYVGSSQLTSYEPAQCAAFCTQTTNCSSFNIFFERDPSFVPNIACVAPASVTNIRCILLGSEITNDTATNNGQFRVNFQVVIAGSNGYNRV